MTIRLEAKVLIIVCLLFFAWTTFALAAEQAEIKSTADSIVAKVNGIDISENEMLERVDLMIRRIGSQIQPGLRPKLRSSLYQQALDSLIATIVLEDAAKKNNITIPDTDVDVRYQEIRKNIPSEEEFKKVLESKGLTEQTLKDSFRKELTLQKVIDTQVPKPAEPTGQEIDQQFKEYYEQKKDQLPPEDSDMIRASHILLNVAKDATDEDKAKVKTELESILKKVKSGELDFAEAAKQYSQCPSAPKGGDLNYFPRGSMVKPFEDVAFALKKDEISDIVETQFGFHIIKLTGQKKAKEVIREQVINFLRQKKENDARNAYIAKLRESAKIDIFMNQDAWKAKYEPKPGEVQIDPSMLQLK